MSSQKFLKLYIIAALFLLPTFVINGQITTDATPQCNFTKSLYLGVKGDDVKCLQDYLKKDGHYTHKYGSTGYYGPVTKEAVASWQKYHNIEPVDGYFGPISKNKYLETFNLNNQTPADNDNSGPNCSKIQELQDILSGLISYLRKKGIHIESPEIKSNECNPREEKRVLQKASHSSGIRVVVAEDNTPVADTTAPALPTNFSITNIDGDIVISWTDPTDLDFASIKIYRGTTSGNLSLLTTVNAGVEGYVDTNVSESTTYYYALSSVDNSNNNSLETSEESISIADTTAPAQPTSLGVVDDNGEAVITWTDPTDLDFASIKIYRGTTSGDLTLLTTINAGVEIYTDTTVSDLTTYYYALSSVDNSSNQSSRTSEVSVSIADYYVPPPTYDEDVLADGPVLYWRLNSTTITDFSGNGYDGLMFGGIQVDNGLTGNGLDFYGTTANTRVYRSSVPPVQNITGPFTLEAIIRLDELPEFDTIIAKGKTSVLSSDPESSPFYLGFANGNRLVFGIHGKPSGSHVSSSISYPFVVESGTNKYYHVAATWDGTTGVDNMKLYINGLLVSSNSQALISLLDHPSSPLWVGNDPVRAGDARFAFGGLIQEVAIYNQALSSIRIKSHSDTAFANSTLTAGNVSLISKSDTAASLSSSAPTGGVLPHTYQWQKSPDGTTWSNISGETSLTLTDEGLTPETEYYYRMVYSDSNSNLATSNSILVETYIYDLNSFTINTSGGPGTNLTAGSLRTSNGKSFIGWSRDSGDFYVTEIDEATKTKTHYLIGNLSPNRHMVPSISELPDGRILTAYDNHINGYMRISTSVGTLADGLSPAIYIPTSVDIKYVQPVVTEEGSGTERIYMFYTHYNGAGRDGSYVYTDNRGASWSSPVKIINKINNEWVYLTARKSIATGRILVGFVDSNASNGNINSSGYLIIYNPSTGNWTRADNTIISIPYTPDATTRVHDAVSTGLEIPYTIYGYETLDNIYLIYAPGGGGQRKTYRSVFNKLSNTWDQQEIIDSAIDPSLKTSGVVMNESDPDTVFIVKEINSVPDVYKYTTIDGGLSWVNSGNQTHGLMTAKNTTNVNPILIEIKGGVENKPRYVFARWSYPSESSWDGVIYISPYNQ